MFSVGLRTSSERTPCRLSVVKVDSVCEAPPALERPRPTLSLKRSRRSRGGFRVFGVLQWILSQAEDRATQGCDPSVAWDPRVDGPASHCGVGLFLLSCQLSCSPPHQLVVSTAINPMRSDSISRFVENQLSLRVGAAVAADLRVDSGDPPGTKWVCGIGRPNYKRVWPTVARRRTIG